MMVVVTGRPHLLAVWRRFISHASECVAACGPHKIIGGVAQLGTQRMFQAESVAFLADAYGPFDRTCRNWLLAKQTAS